VLGPAIAQDLRTPGIIAHGGVRPGQDPARRAIPTRSRRDPGTISDAIHGTEALALLGITRP
jgi:hypothetical protein